MTITANSSLLRCSLNIPSKNWKEIVGCSLASITLFFLGIINDFDADNLSSVTRVNRLNGLARLLDTATPRVVSISGRVNSDKPMNGKLSGLQCVIMEEKKEKHFLKRNDAGKWIRHSKLMSSNVIEVPWFLDDGTARINVVGAKDASCLKLTVRNEDFEELGQSAMGKTSDDSDGLKMLGVKRFEQVLPIGTSMTVVGEAAKDNVGTIRVQRPHNGPFYVSHMTIDQLIDHHRVCAGACKVGSIGFMVFGVYLVARNTFHYVMERSRHWKLRKSVCKYASMGFVAFGVYLVAKHTVQYITERRRHPKLRKSVPDTAAKRSPPHNEGSKGTQNGSDICVVCLDQEYNSVFIPCGHMCCCLACSSYLTKCPLCRHRIERVVRTFRS